MIDTHLSSRLLLVHGSFLDGFKKEKSEHKAKSDQKPEFFFYVISNLLDSLVSNYEVYFNKTSVYNDNGSCNHKAQISYDFNSSAVSVRRILTFMKIVLKNVWKILICIRSMKEEIP